ncbi:MAG: ATP-dependent metallopeptidase FtsH/Yme1/Tma family protein [Planctomycetes bacterium]|nr:ATP-dependent metallopeptidase FtsH/Yme1/Tma family protein [Planctomycetota bacterium]
MDSGQKNPTPLRPADRPADRPDGGGRFQRGPAIWLWGLLILAALLFLYHTSSWRRPPKISYSTFLALIHDRKIEEVEFEGQLVRGKLHQDKDLTGATDVDGRPLTGVGEFQVTIPPIEDHTLVEKLVESKATIKAQPLKESILNLLGIWLPAIVVLGVIFLMIRRARDVEGTILGSFIKSPAKRYEKLKTRVTFEDVANLENAKLELQEIVEFLKNPERFQRLGAQIPKGVLLMGPPGTGKTLLARAVAGEAGVPFYSISGSEFIQMFVGVGASRVRDMFKTAKENAPCILFIDEIDAVGRVRGAGLGGGHDEREQTLNQILSEMDGFLPNESVIVLAATNRPDVLDTALLRPGRFDRHITVDRPTRQGRHDILKVHARNVACSHDVDFDSLARGTVGLTGADLRNLVNEAALLATRQGKDQVEMVDFEQARDRVLMGPKREEVLTDKEKRMTAYHEAGHALLAWNIPEADPLHKVTIIPRGRSLGVTQQLPEEDRHSYSQVYLVARLTVAMGGRAAEKLVFDEVSSGAESDLREATRLARYMVTHWGMSDRVGPVSFRVGEEHVFLGKEIHEPRDFSENTARIIDEEIGRILREADERARSILGENRHDLDRLAEALVRLEVLTPPEIEEVLSSVDEPVEAEGMPLKKV